MKTVHLKLFFPRNWYHARRLKIYHKSELIAYIMHGDSLEIYLPDEATSIHWKLDYFRNTIALPQQQDPIYLLLFMDVGKGLIQLYRKTLNSRCIQGKVVTAEEFEHSTSATIYQSHLEWLPIARLDKSNLYIGLLTASITLFYSVYSKTEWRAILFLLGGGTILSFLILLFEKDKITLSDYKNRMWATVGSFVLSILLIPAKDYVVQILLLILTIGFTLRFIQHTQKLRTN
ncbi:hypothetical protein H4K35_08695 [Myroides sp. NP-2]|uniref:hypothetical protein n=1 Tax=Myroides sp. NP-2 TaxID=2759945 RepID=UPI0015F9CB48|nr:hypothetical protein [Myroides sp. NP-2]MBB1150207.1 hypothetical protein [Myroides sp. NP-2]